MAKTLLNRIIKIKNGIERKMGKEEPSNFIIRAKDGLYLYDSINKRKEINTALIGYEIKDFSNFSIKDIFVIYINENNPIVITDNLKEDQLLRKYFNDNILNFKELTTDEIKELIEYCEG